jgi:hypothetical protein
MIENVVGTNKKPRKNGVFVSALIVTSLGGDNADVFAIFRAFGLEFHRAFALSEQGVVFAAANIHARVYARAALAQDNIAGDNGFTAELFHPKAFGF